MEFPRRRFDHLSAGALSAVIKTSNSWPNFARNLMGSRCMAVRTLVAGSLAAALGNLLAWNDAFAQQFTVLYSFCSQPNCADGSRPVAGLTRGNLGALYGTTNVGGSSGNGTAFRLMPPATAGNPWTETVLYNFCSLAQCIDGYDPAYPLLTHKGALYGAAPSGGTGRGGTVFKLTPPATAGQSWVETVLYSFCSLSNCADGGVPQGDLIADQNGALFGTTQSGGSSGNGTVFKLTPPAADGNPWTETVLYNFCSLSNCADGAAPRAGLLMDDQGALYGTTQYFGGGLVFKLIPPSMTGGLWAETVLYRFCSVLNCTDGAYPQANLIMDSLGALYGTTISGGIFGANVIGGSPGQGTVFKVTPPSVSGNPWTETVLYRFCSQSYCADGAGPASRLIMDQTGALYGTTVSGGSDGRSGTVFKLTPPSVTDGPWTETVLHSFCSLPNCADGAQPFGDLIAHGGVLYGTASSGPNNGEGGTVFKMTH
jgi:uncharacterized repeat protein (TIGR03803 family)